MTETSIQPAVLGLEEQLRLHLDELAMQRAPAVVRIHPRGRSSSPSTSPSNTFGALVCALRPETEPRGSVRSSDMQLSAPMARP